MSSNCTGIEKPWWDLQPGPFTTAVWKSNQTHSSSLLRNLHICISGTYLKLLSEEGVLEKQNRRIHCSLYNWIKTLLHLGQCCLLRLAVALPRFLGLCSFPLPLTGDAGDGRGAFCTPSRHSTLNRGPSHNGIWHLLPPVSKMCSGKGVVSILWGVWSIRAKQPWGSDRPVWTMWCLEHSPQSSATSTIVHILQVR